jgi:hypothetical protein
VVQLRGLDQRVDQLLDVRRPLDLTQVVGLPARDRELRGEELAAVLVGQDGDLVGAELPRDLHDLLLVAVDQGAQERQLGRLLDHREVGERLRGDLPQGVAGHQRLGALAPAERRGHLHHQAPLRQHLKPAGARCRKPALRGPERDDE